MGTARSVVLAVCRGCNSLCIDSPRGRVISDMIRLSPQMGVGGVVGSR